MNKLTDILGRFFKDDKSVRNMLNFVISVILIVAAAMLIYNVFLDEQEDNRIIFDNDSREIDAENLYMSEEQRLSDILSDVRGVGEAKVMLTFGQNDSGEEVVKGVIVVAKGAGDSVVKDKIMTAAQSVFNVPVSRITVLESK